MRSLKFSSVALAVTLFAVQASSAAAQTSASGLSFKPGVYQCELNRSVHVRHVSADMQSAVVSWDKKEYTLKAVNARTGALRYEDQASGLVWLVIVGKSMLLDTKHGKQLANECKV